MRLRLACYCVEARVFGQLALAYARAIDVFALDSDRREVAEEAQTLAERKKEEARYRAKAETQR